MFFDFLQFMANLTLASLLVKYLLIKTNGSQFGNAVAFLYA